MPQLHILNTKEIKEVLKLIEAQWDAKLDLNYAFLKNNKERIFIINKDIQNIELDKLRINSIGIYFCEVDRIGIRLSIEGSQIVGPKATKNVVEITEEQEKQWLKGEDLEVEDKGDYTGFVIIKNNNDFLGTGKFKENKVLNYVNKSRRINAIH